MFKSQGKNVIRLVVSKGDFMENGEEEGYCLGLFQLEYYGKGAENEGLEFRLKLG